jgi:Ca2+-binding EF-hand superfamily protein
MIAAIVSTAAAPAFAIVVPTSRAASAPPPSVAPKQVTRTQFLSNYQARFNAADTNHDGVLDANEIAAEQQKALQAVRAKQQQQLEAEFNKLDTNHDGQLSKAEFLATARPVEMRSTPQQVISAMDANRDGKISLQEYEAGPLANFNKVDANHDGIITPQEIQAARAAARKR